MMTQKEALSSSRRSRDLMWRSLEDCPVCASNLSRLSGLRRVRLMQEEEEEEEEYSGDGLCDGGSDDCCSNSEANSRRSCDPDCPFHNRGPLISRRPPPPPPPPKDFCRREGCGCGEGARGGGRRF